MVEKANEPVIVKDGEHTIPDDAFTLSIRTNDDFFVNEGHAPRDHKIDCRGYLLYTTLANGETCLNAQGEVSFTQFILHMLDVVDAKKLRKIIDACETMRTVKEAKELLGRLSKADKE